jgi:hypothetical protein
MRALRKRHTFQPMCVTFGGRCLYRTRMIMAQTGVDEKDSFGEHKPSRNKAWRGLRPQPKGLGIGDWGLEDGDSREQTTLLDVRTASWTRLSATTEDT